MKAADAEAFIAMPFTVGSETVTRFLLATVASDTTTSLADCAAVAVTAAAKSSTAVTVPNEATVALN